MRADDTLKCAALVLRDRLSCIAHEMCGLRCQFEDEDYDFCLRYILGLADDIRLLAALFGDLDRWADVRAAGSTLAHILRTLPMSDKARERITEVMSGGGVDES